jgi:hypothetical protein
MIQGRRQGCGSGAPAGGQPPAGEGLQSRQSKARGAHDQGPGIRQWQDTGPTGIQGEPGRHRVALPAPAYARCEPPSVGRARACSGRRAGVSVEPSHPRRCAAGARSAAHVALAAMRARTHVEGKATLSSCPMS